VDFFRSHYEPIGQSTFLADIELHRMYYFLTQLRDEFEPLRAQLLACYPCVSLMHALAEVRNEETCLYDAGLLRVSSVFIARSSVAHPTTPVPSTSHPVAPSVACGESTSLHCEHCGRDGHVEAFFYRKKKSQKDQTHVPHKVLVFLVLEGLRGVMLFQRHMSWSCYFVTLRPLRH
jgi:hypothetical protein